jgi:UDP-N-acetyl-D-glucosamine dehydrogenase
MPNHVVQRVADALNDSGKPIRGSRLLLLGMAYKADVHDIRESPSLEILRQLEARGAEVRYCDPWVDQVEIEGNLYSSVSWSEDEVRAADCVVMLTPHREFLQAPLWDKASSVVDTRNVVPPGPGVRSI